MKKEEDEEEKTKDCKIGNLACLSDKIAFSCVWNDYYLISANILYFNIIPAEMNSLPSFWFECAFIHFESSLLAFEKCVENV